MTKLEQFRGVCYTKDRKKREIPEEQGGGSCMEKKIISKEDERISDMMKENMKLCDNNFLNGES